MGGQPAHELGRGLDAGRVDPQAQAPGQGVGDGVANDARLPPVRCLRTARPPAIVRQLECGQDFSAQDFPVSTPPTLARGASSGYSFSNESTP
jgi:hypothetical protein